MCIRDRFEVSPIPASVQNGKGLTTERFLLASTLSPLGLQNSEAEGRYRINLSLTDLRSGYVLAQAGVNTTATGVDATPTSFYPVSYTHLDVYKRQGATGVT